MDQSLRLLLLLQSKSLFRQLTRLLKTKRGILVIVTLTLVLTVMGLPLAISIFAGSTFRQHVDFQSIELYLTFGMCFMTITQLTQRSGSHGIYFAEAEIENLFTAPISRRQLLGYRMFIELRQSLFASVFALIAGALYLPNLVCGLTGMILVMTFARMLPILLAILGQTAGSQLYTLRRKMIGYTILGILSVAMLSQISNIKLESAQDFVEGLKAIANSWIGSIVLFPFRIFAKTTFSASFDLQFLGYATASLAMIAGLAIAIFAADANYFSVVERTSRIKLKQLKQLQVGALRKEYSFTLPMPPFMAGVGPLVWRQALSTIRTNIHLLPVIFLLVVGLVYGIVFHDEWIESPAFPPVFLSSLAYITLLMAMVAPVGFKADIQKMENLKALPFSNWTIVIGQTFAATLAASSLQLAIIAIVAIVNFDRHFVWLLGALAVCPLNYLMLTGSSIILLLFPVKTGKDGSTTVSSLGQAFISMISLIALMGTAMGSVAGISALAYLMSQNIPVTAATGGFGFLIVSATLTWILKWAYSRFDVSRDTPI